MSSSHTTSTTPSSTTATWSIDPYWQSLLFPYSRSDPPEANKRPYPELWDIAPGSILWLPPKAELETISPNSSPIILPGSKLFHQPYPFFNHPILILSVSINTPQTATILFAKMTSLSKKTLQEAHPNKPDRRLKYLPIHPALPHPDTGDLLHLHSTSLNRSMSEISYVSLGEGAFEMDWRGVRCYNIAAKADGYRYRLREESLHRVRDAMGLPRERWVENDALWEHFRDKYLP